MYALIGTWQMCLTGARKGTALLQSGLPAGDAVEQAIMTVEDEPAYTSVGYGGLPDSSGHVMLDAAYMDGRTLHMGGIMSAENIRNPISLARKLCGRETNCLLAGRGAEQAAVSLGLPLRDMRTEGSMEKWRKAVSEEQTKLSAYQGHDTVCVLALDEQGGMAAGTSTSGLFMKEPGRVGDSPIIGSGFYCDDRYGAAAATGLGEDIMRGCLSYETVSLMRPFSRGGLPGSAGLTDGAEREPGRGQGFHQPDCAGTGRRIRGGDDAAGLPVCRGKGRSGRTVRGLARRSGMPGGQPGRDRRRTIKDPSLRS